MKMKTRAELYRRRVKRLKFIEANQTRLYNRFGLARAVVFFLGVVSFFWLRSLPSPMIAYLALGLALLSFSILIIIHDRFSRYRDKITSFLKINRESVERVSDLWSAFKRDGSEYCTRDLPYKADLDIFGKNSLFQMIQQTVTKRGGDSLAKLLSQCGEFSSLKARQEAVRELKGSISFRHRLLLEGRLAPSSLDSGELLRWSRTPAFLLNKRWLLLLRCTLLTTSAGLLLYYLAYGGATLFLIPLSAQMLLFVLTAMQCQERYKPALFAEASFLAYSGMFRTIERGRFDSPSLLELQGRIKAGGMSLSKKMEELERINHQLSICFSLIYPFLNILFLWDLHYLYRQELWKEEMKDSLEACFDALATFEALSSLAGFAFDNPDYSWPSIDTNALPFNAEALGHPLIPENERVCNDISVADPGEVMLITGSNMSGKSTFIRTVGINMILAFSGAPVAAGRLEARPSKIMTCIQVLDSLKLHLSHFYAEVQEIKTILNSVFPEEATVSDLPVFYLIDEIFSGTNTRERLLASRGIILKLAASNSYGLLTTHDLDLTALEDESPKVVNHHFQDDVSDDGRMIFDYRVKEGPVTSTNALKVIKLAGITLDG